MQISRPIVWWLPEKLMEKLEAHIAVNPPSWKYDPVYFQYLVHHLTVKQIQQKTNEYFSLNTRKLKDVTVWNINKYIIYLVNGEFLKRDYFINGVRSYRYKINPEYLKGSRRIELEPGTLLHKKIIHSQKLKRSHVNRMKPFLKQMRDYFMKVDMDYSQARMWIEFQPDEIKKYSYHTALSMIEDERFRYFKRNKTNNRLDTNFTNLKSELLPFMKGDFVSIDLANSQPFFLSQLLNFINQTENINTKVSTTISLLHSLSDLNVTQWLGLQQIKGLSKLRQNDPFSKNGELLKFTNLVVPGTLYDDFIPLFFGEGLTREKVKDMMFKVLFSQNVIYKDYKRIVPYQKEKEQFASVFPSIFIAVHTLKQKDHARLPILLQKMESLIFIDAICPALIEQDIIPLTKHDSVIVEAGQVDKALNICQNVFKQQYRIIPSFHIEPLKPLS